MSVVRPYLMLISMSKANAATGKSILDNIKRSVDPAAKPLWFDSAHVGVAMTTELMALEIWPLALTGIRDELTDALILQVGRDWAARRDSKYDHWLTSHLGGPLLPDPKRGSR